mmetsp:Transcript_8944/g.16434  ORF Transcript_8944/g.16434 Transcript_8944/m.16434 type:complete len:123 (+) Transcript_8944:603-971(+)
MVGKLVSKEYLYPAVKDITAKFPEFLEKNKGKIPDKEYEQYEAQYQCFKELCETFENEGESESGSKKVVDLMQKMQSYGVPPQEIMSGLLPGMQFDNDGMPVLPGMSSAGGEGGNPEDCCLM